MAHFYCIILVYETTTVPKSYFLIGDVHSQGTILSKALAHAKARKLTPVFLGDIFDSRCANSETIYVYHQVRLAEKELGAIVLNSNHQLRLLNFFNGETESPSYAEETWRTMAEFEDSGLDLREICEWLDSLPAGFVFSDKYGRRHACAHAYFPPQLMRKGEEEWFVTDISKDQRYEMAWGPVWPTKGGRYRRRYWWREDHLRNWTMCVGHYHTVWVDDKSIVLDANCGYEAGMLPAYEVDNKVLVHFDEKRVQSVKLPRHHG